MRALPRRSAWPLLAAFASALAGSARAQGIVEIELNQVLGRARALDGSLAPVERFVAGKDTVVRVLLSAPVTVDAAGGSQSLEVSRDGTAVATLGPTPSEAPTNVLTFRCPTRLACGDWAAGTYRFAAKVGGASAAREDVLFEVRRPLRVLAVPLKARYGAEVREGDERWKRAGAFTRDVAPVGLAGFRYVLREPLDVSGPGYDLTTEGGRRAVWEALSRLVPPECSARPDASGCFDAVVGFVPSRIPLGQGTLKGFTFGRPASVSVSAEADMPAAVAHEIAHLLGIGDEYRGGSIRCAVNPPPPAYQGKDWDSGSDVRCSASTQREPPAPAEGSVVFADTDRPFEVTGRGPLGDSVSYMGSSFPDPDPQALAWTTWPVYSFLFDQLAPPSAGPVRPLAGPTRVADASLRVAKDGRVDLLPWRTFVSTADVEQKSGTHGIQVLDVTGKILSVQSFTPESLVRTNPPREVDPAAVVGLAIPFPETARKVRVLKGSQVLREAAVSFSRPELAITAPLGGTLSGKATISWTARDDDGDSLTYEVAYSEDGQEWHTLASGLTATQLVQDFDDLPGSPYASVRVSATDGFLTTTAVSAPFAVAFKPPEVFIEEPAAGGTLVRGTQVLFSGAAYDLQEDWLTDASQLVWSSSRDGELGRGPSLAVDGLSAGSHLVTLTATSAGGQSARATVAVTVVERGAPAPPLAAAFRAVPESPAAGEDVRFEDLSTGGPASFSWSFGDGGTSTEPNPRHAFTEPGSVQVRLEVSKGGVRSSATATVAVRPAGSGALATFFVPVVLRLSGLASSDYSTEMTLTNRGDRTAAVSYAYTATVAGGSGVAIDAESVGPGTQVVVRDVIQYLRDKGVPIPASGSRLGTLRVTFAGLSSPLDASVVLRTTTPVPAGGRAGLAYSGIPTSSLLSHPVTLCGLRQTDAERSAVAVQNAGTSGNVTLRLSLYDGATEGSRPPVGTAEVTVGPGGFAQKSLGDLGADALSQRQGYVQVERIAGTSPFNTYGVINDGVTSDGSFVSPVPARGLAVAPGLTLPVVVDAGRYVTEVTLTNLSAAARELELTLASAGLPGGSVSATLRLGAGSQRLIPRFVAWLREQVPDLPAGSILGPLFVRAKDGGLLKGIVLGGRTWNLADQADPARGAYGVAYGAVPFGASSTGTLLVNGLKQDGESRSNLALVNTGERTATPIILKLEVFDATTGEKAADLAETLAARQFRQLDAVLGRFPGLTNGWIRVSRITGASPFLTYGVINDGAQPGQGSGDGAFVAGEAPVP